MEAQFWQAKWTNLEIGFHQDKYNHYLIKFWSKIAKSKGSVFVPLCGKTKDMIFLSEQGHKVVGVELSQKAVKMFFEENNLIYSVMKIGTFELFESENIKIYVGSLFELDPEWVVSCEYLYDRASIVALPREMRIQYGKFLNQLNLKAGLMIIMVFNAKDHDEFGDDQIGPPFSIPLKELKHLLKNLSFSILEEKEESADQLEVHVGKIGHRKEYALRLELSY